jgi:hypothetical protein
MVRGSTPFSLIIEIHALAVTANGSFPFYQVFILTFPSEFGNFLSIQRPCINTLQPHIGWEYGLKKVETPFLKKEWGFLSQCHCGRTVQND